MNFACLCLYVSFSLIRYFECQLFCFISCYLSLSIHRVIRSHVNILWPSGHWNTLLVNFGRWYMIRSAQLLWFCANHHRIRFVFNAFQLCCHHWLCAVIIFNKMGYICLYFNAWNVLQSTCSKVETHSRVFLSLLYIRISMMSNVLTIFSVIFFIFISKSSITDPQAKMQKSHSLSLIHSKWFFFSSPYICFNLFQFKWIFDLKKKNCFQNIFKYWLLVN